VHTKTITIKVGDRSCCGTGGTPKEWTNPANGNVYKVHEYATGTSGAYQCWLVQGANEAGGTQYTVNSAMWTFTARFYIGGKVNDTYCPTGWRLPTSTEIGKLNKAAYIDLLFNAMRWCVTGNNPLDFGAGYFYYNSSNGYAQMTSSGDVSVVSGGTGTCQITCVQK
jgi:hypothetical protein